MSTLKEVIDEMDFAYGKVKTAAQALLDLDRVSVRTESAKRLVGQACARLEMACDILRTQVAVWRDAETASIEELEAAEGVLSREEEES